MEEAADGGRRTAVDAGEREARRWRRRKRLALGDYGTRTASRPAMDGGEHTADPGTLFRNPFQIADLAALDEAALARVLAEAGEALSMRDLAVSLRGSPSALTARVAAALPAAKRRAFSRGLARGAGRGDPAARRRVLDALFWGLTYARTPRLYDELVAGETLHPGIFRRLAPWLRGATVLDAGAGSGRATFCALAAGAARVVAADPEPGLLALLREKASGRRADRVLPVQAVTGALPLREGAVDVTLCASAFFVDGAAERRLAELERVTRPGGVIALIWPRPEDFAWLAAHGFRYTALPVRREMRVRFPSLREGLRLARRFYGRRPAVVRYLRRSRHRSVPYAVLGVNPPHDFCWLVAGAAPGRLGHAPQRPAGPRSSPWRSLRTEHGGQRAAPGAPRHQRRRSPTIRRRQRRRAATSLSARPPGRRDRRQRRRSTRET